MGVITTSITIDFDAGDGDEGILKAEIDDRPTGYNSGVTNFVPGDSPVFLVFKTSNVTIDRMESSLGTISSVGSGTKEIEEFITFADTREASPGYPVSGGFSYEWFGGSGSPTVSESKITIPAKTVGVMKIKYDAKFSAYRLSSPTSYNGVTTFPIVVFIAGSTS